MSGDWILFGRQVLAQHRSLVLLHNTSTDDTITLADIRGAGTIAHPGQVSGNWAVWDRCTAHRVCDVYRYDIAGDVKEKIPKRSRAGISTSRRSRPPAPCTSFTRATAAAST